MQSRLFALPIPLGLLMSLACWSAPGTSNARLKTAARDARPEAAASASPTPAATPAATAARAPGFADADFARHVNELKARLQKALSSSGSSRGVTGDSAAEFSIVIQRPFVVVGDEPEKMVRQHADDTVKWAVDRLKQDFFTRDPNEILDIWLFKDEASYKKHTQLLFGESPTTPYGYYSPVQKALIMNIATGGGTLVHEIVHPFMEANFPNCPPWLNEGLGSLYEQCGDRDGHIHGFTNWRLPGLQRAIEAKQVPSFADLTEMSSNVFYNQDKGTNYSQSRYLCYYLQENGVLVKFYREFLARQQEDPSGFKSLQKILAERDMEAFKTKWEKYVMALKQGWDVTAE